jgi:hypothetical protein
MMFSVVLKEEKQVQMQFSSSQFILPESFHSNHLTKPKNPTPF